MSKRLSISQIRAGVIGSGFIGPVHIEALRRLGVQVTALCGSDKAHSVAEKWGIPVAIPGYDHRALLERDDVDVVHITSPNRHHHTQALDALRAGKHVVCEKPLAMSARESAEIVRAAARSPRIFAVNYNVRFYPAVLQLRAVVQRGDLGEIVHVNGSYFQDWLLEETDYNWRLLASEGGVLRAVADIGTHWLDTVSFILGSRIEAVFAHLSTFHKTRQRPLGEVQTFARAARKQRYASYTVKTEDFASILLRFASGAHGNLAVSQVAAGRKNSIRVEIYGAKKSAWWDAEEPNTIHYGSRSGPNEASTRATPGFATDVADFTDYPAGHAEGFPDTFKMLYRAVYEAIARGKPARPLYATAADGHEEVKLCEAVLRSHAAKAWARV
jgi:predicted dehydrogenase